MKAGHHGISVILVLPLLLMLGGCGGSSGNQTMPSPSTGTITEFSTSSSPVKILKGLDGDLWVLAFGVEAGLVTRMTTDGKMGTVGTVLNLNDAAFGPDGNLWFVTGVIFSGLGRMTATGASQTFAVPTVGAGIAVGPDNNLWVAAINPEFDVYSTAGMFLHSFAISHSTTSFTSGPDGNVWFAFGNNAAKITTAGVVTTFTFPQVQTFFNQITAGPDGNLWLCVGDSGTGSDAIARLTTSGTLTLFPVPTAKSNPFGITTGPDGNLWFTERAGNKIGRITPSGTITEFALPTPGSAPLSIVAGPDGFLWFTEPGTSKIGKIHP